MKRKPYILLIAPNAPPKNGAEAIQVGRILRAIDTRTIGRLITVPAENSGWLTHDASLDIPLKNFDVQTLRLPLHHLINRIIKSHRLRHIMAPDALVWITWMTGKIIRELTQQPDIIYSRSSPASAALLGLRLKKKLGTPWIMHLSDPWVDNPYLPQHSENQESEAACFSEADLITLTTQTQAAFYQNKYPAAAHKIVVSPNMMLDPATVAAAPPLPNNDALLRIVLAGNFYGDRSPKPLIDALIILQRTQPELLSKLHIDVYGNAPDEAETLLRSMPGIIGYHGSVSFAEAQKAQESADILLSIEPEIDHPLSSGFLPSKVLDCLALGKPLLAIAPDDSETAKICRDGYGWTARPSYPDHIAQLLATCLRTPPASRQMPAKTPPQRYTIQTIVDDLLLHINRLLVEPRP